MKTLLLGVLLIPALLAAEPVQVEKKVVCDKLEVVLKTLKEYGEKPLWFGKADGSQVAILINPQTKSWTVIQFNDKIACVLETGEQYDFRTDALGWKSVRHKLKLIV